MAWASWKPRQMPSILSPSGVAQKVAGKSFGVTKKSNLVIVKTLSNAASFIDALSKIIFDMDSMKSKGVRGEER